ncbi:hypothetical protein EB796_023663 [Bugula neritina]|uniref:Uncharacterized protein n=1 Tax=Bugula neritina TaxID=10212 RepID=A0A7J7IW34_BUGNE|nr:hypothetical protein EB796_023663 [Bugula neritina]
MIQWIRCSVSIWLLVFEVQQSEDFLYIIYIICCDFFFVIVFQRMLVFISIVLHYHPCEKYRITLINI